jgi:hypothetical protein
MIDSPAASRSAIEDCRHLSQSPTAQLDEATMGRMWWSEPATPPDRDTERHVVYELVVDERGVVM